MEAWMIYFRKQAEYNSQYIRLYQEEGKKLGVFIRLILAEELEFGINNNGCFLTSQGEKLTKPDFAINRTIYPLLSRQLELMEIPVFNNSFVAEICNDKARTFQYLTKTGIKMADTCFYKNFQLKDVLSRTIVSYVIKADDGHGGGQVFLTGGSDGEDEIRKGIGSSDFVVQPLIGNRHQDLRVYVIGREIIASVLRTAKEGFKSNYSLGGEVSLYRLAASERRIVNRIIREFDFGLAGIDFLLDDDGELIFNEIEDVVGARMLYQCSDINIVKQYLDYIYRRVRKEN